MHLTIAGAGFGNIGIYFPAWEMVWTEEKMEGGL